MSMYRLKLLGDIQLTDPAGAIAMPGRKLKAIIAYLALNGDSVLPREHLAAMFWPEASTQQTRQNLRRMLARAKALFGAEASEFLANEPESIMLATTWLAVDVLCDLLDGRGNGGLVAPELIRVSEPFDDWLRNGERRWKCLVCLTPTAGPGRTD